jgi:hypothetical protein
MMAYLLTIDGASIDPTLEGFSEDRIKWLFHIQIKISICKREHSNEFEPFDWIILLSDPFKK